MKFRSSKEQGFTLIELLVVIAIIGTLASTVLVSVQNARFVARDARVKTDIKQVQIALEMFRSANGRYPGRLNGNLNLSDLNGVDAWGVNNSILPYINPIPTNPHIITPPFQYRYWPSPDGSNPNSYTMLFRLYEDSASLSVWCSVSEGPNPPSWSTTHAPCF